MMKILLLVLGLCCLSAALLARDLPGLAKREKARRRAIASQSQSRDALSFDDSDLESYRRSRGEAGPDVVRRPGAALASSAGRAPADPELERQKRYWREEATRHERELARLDASIRKLEWRLVERRSRRRPSERLSDDPTADMLEDSIDNLREQRKLLDERFRRRAREAGAFPGWLR